MILQCFQPYDSSNSSKDQYVSQSLQKSFSRRDPSSSPHGATENGHGFPYVIHNVVLQFYFINDNFSLSAATSVNKFLIRITWNGCRLVQST